MSGDGNDLAGLLAAALSSHLDSSVTIENLARLTGGASRETWSFDAVDEAADRRALILRRDFPDGGTPSLSALLGIGADLDRRGEFALFECLHRAGIPVPRPVLLPDPASGLGSCFVMERVAGESMPRRLLSDDTYGEARTAMTPQLATVLAKIHSLDPERLPPLPVEPSDSQIAMVRRMTEFGAGPRPVFEYALRWLGDNRPALQSGLRLVHGDFRNGNFVVGPDGLVAVLDWEYAHLGDPMEDLGFLCMRPWRFGRVEHDVGGFGPREELLRAYEEAGGCRVDADVVRYWEVLGNLKWGALCVIRAMAHIGGIGRSVEVAAIGRRVAETEYDILELIGG